MKEKLEALKNNDGLTLKAYKAITYKTGYQVADYGTECKTIAEALKAIDQMEGNCGIWYSDGIYADGKKYNQISVLKWSDMSLVYC